MKEKELSHEFQDYFKKWFDIETEVCPVGSRKRIDLVMTSKLNKDFIFGIELKNDVHKQGNNLAKWVKQAEGYSKQKFNIRGYERIIPVLIAPSISGMFAQKVEGIQPIIKENYEYTHPRTGKIEVESREFFAATHYNYHLHHNLNGLISEFNIGEVRKVYADWENKKQLGYGFIFKNQLLWHELTNHHIVNYKRYFKWHK